jgi:uncharacterized protein YjbJ (UPF0337 family)
MGADDKARNKVDEMRGDAKERVGGAIGNDSMRREGKRDQTKANLKQAGENVKDAVHK